jgi:hypothetical protein
MRVLTVVALFTLSGCASGGGTTTVGASETPSTVRVSDGTSSLLNVTTRPTVDANVSTVAFPVDRVWSVLPSVFESIGIPATTNDLASHTIGNSGFNIRRRLGSTPLPRYIDCGASQAVPNADTYEIHFAIMTKVESDGGSGSKLSTTIQAMGRPVAYSGEYVRCGSFGVLEARITDGVKSALKK